MIPPRRDEIRDVHVRAAALRVARPVGVTGWGGTTRRAEEVGVVVVVVRRRRCKRPLAVFFLKNDSARPMLGARFKGAGLKLVVAEEWGFS